jgi:RNA polymerase sigma factor (sigma-70 family)
MRPRQTIIELFSKFVQFEGDRFHAWLTDAKLRRSMENCLNQASDATPSENFWALYWYNLWHSQTSHLAKSHLTAYLQEPCYWTSQKIASAFASTQYTLSDCFQVAIANLDTVLKGFNPSQGFALKNYAAAIFSSTLHNILRQRQEIDICTDYALLRKLSQKRLVESLQQAGLSQEKIASYVLAWNCFKTIYVPTQATATRKLTAPDQETWNAIANLYNQQRLQQPGVKESQAETIEKWLLACAKAARAYLYPTSISLNTPKSGENAEEFLDSLPETATPSLLTEIIAQEEAQSRAEQLGQINTVLSTALADLDQEAKTILQLYYAQELTQQQIAKQLDIKQYTVSRRLTKTKESLLLALGRWSKEELHISMNSDVLKDISTVLEVWLKLHYVEG